MEGYDDQAAVRFQHLLGVQQRAHQLAALVIDEHAQRLESARGRMRAFALPPSQRALDEIGEIERGGEGLVLPPMHDGAGDAAGAGLFAKNMEDIREFGLGQLVDGVGRAKDHVCAIRISSGPSRMKEKPRSASSIWKEDTPRSSITPSTCS